MIVISAKDIPSSIRGKLKGFFIEVKPYVLVSGVSDSLARKIVEEIVKACGNDYEMTILESLRRPPGYKVWYLGRPDGNKIIEITGMQLLLED